MAAVSFNYASQMRYPVNRELKQATFLTTRTLTGSEFDVFDQSRHLRQPLWRPCCVKNVACLSSLFSFQISESTMTENRDLKIGVCG